MVSLARLGLLAVVGVAAAAVALPHLVAAQPAAPAPQPIGPVVPAGLDEVPTRRLRVPPPPPLLPPPARFEADHLPKLAPYALPPRLILRARTQPDAPNLTIP